MKQWKVAASVLTRFQCPGDDQGNETDSGMWFPLIGAVSGAFLMVIMAVSTAAWGKGAVGALLAALVVFAAEAWLTRGRRYAGLIETLEQEFPSNSQMVGFYVRLSVFQSMVLLKIFALLVLAAHGQMAWLILVFALAGMTAVDCGAGKSGASITSRNAAAGSWVMGLAVALLVGVALGRPMPALAAAAGTWLAPLAMLRILGVEGHVGERWSAAMEEVVILGTLLIGALAS